MNLTLRSEVAGLRTSIVCGHIRYIRPAPGWRAWRAALGLPLAPFISCALREWETRVTGKGDVPRGARAAEVGGAPPCLVELRVPAGSAEPWLRTQLQPRSIRRPFRHETQNMPLCWPRAQPGLLPAPVTTAARTSGGRPHAAAENSGAGSGARLACSWCRARPPRAGVMSGRDSRPPDAPAVRGIFAARCRGATRHLGPLLSGCTVRPRRTR